MNFCFFGRTLRNMNSCGPVGLYLNAKLSVVRRSSSHEESQLNGIERRTGKMRNKIYVFIQGQVWSTKFILGQDLLSENLSIVIVNVFCNIRFLILYPQQIKTGGLKNGISYHSDPVHYSASTCLGAPETLSTHKKLILMYTHRPVK